MKSPRKRAIAVEIENDELRFAEVVKRGRASVVRLGAAEAPGGADALGVPSADAMAQALRNLTSELRAATAPVIIGLPDSAFSARTLNLPDIPYVEMREVVRGELERFQFVDEGGAFFDFRVLAKGEPEVPVLVVAAKTEVVSRIEEAASKAGVTIAGIEPAPLAMMRAALQGQPIQRPCAVVAVGPTRTDIGIAYGGGLRYYRRVSIGTSSLIVANQEDASRKKSRGAPAPMVDNYEAVADEVPIGDQWLNKAEGLALATEIQRSLEYHRRENPAFEGIETVWIAIGEDRLRKAADWLGQTLGLAYQVAGLESFDLAEELYGETDRRFLASIGLALPGDDPFPRFDLYASKRRVVERASSQLTVGIAASILILLLGTAIAGMFAKRAATAQAAVTALRSQEAKLKSEIKPEGQNRQQIKTQLSSLRNQSVPFPQILDQVSSALAGGVGLSEVQIDANRKMVLVGEATGTAAVIESAENLRKLSFLSLVNVDSIDTTATNLAPGSVRFFLSAQVGSPPPPKASPTPGGAK